MRKAYLTFCSWVAMLALKQIGYKGIMPVEVDGIDVMILVPSDISEWVPQGGGTS